MSVLLKTIQFFEQDDSTQTKPVTIVDDEKTNLKISLKNKGSGMEIILKNNDGKHISEGVFRWKEQDTVKVFLKYTDDPSEVIDTESSDDLIMIGEIEEFEAELGENSTKWKLKIVDKSFILLNKLWAKAYLKNDTHIVGTTTETGWTPPELITDIISVVTAKGNKTSEVKASLAVGTFDSDGKFTRASGGYIQNIRPDGRAWDANDDDSKNIRQQLSIAKVFKPLYEWINDLGTIERTNTTYEQSNGLVCKRPYQYFIDEDNNFHWEYAGTATDSYLITVGATAAAGADVEVYDKLQEKTIEFTDNVHHRVYSGKLKKSIFDVVNMVIFNAGDDFNGTGILDYFYNPISKSSVLKPVYKPMTDIAKTFKKQEIITENSANYTENNDTGTLFYESTKYDANDGASTYPFQPSWNKASNDPTVTSDKELNDSFRTFCIATGDSRGADITNLRSNARYKGTITLKGYKYKVGNVVIFNDSLHGIVNEFLRITDIQHTIDASGWFTTISVEEDADKRE